MSRRRRLAVLLSVLTAVVWLGGAAQGYWRAGGGSGSGSATTSTVTAAVTLTPGTPAPGLFPGGSSDVLLTATNPNSAAVRLGSLTLDTTRGSSGFDVDAGHASCSTSALTFSLPASPGWTVPGRSGGTDGSLAVTLTGAVSMSTAAANACQGARFTVYLQAGP